MKFISFINKYLFDFKEIDVKNYSKKNIHLVSFSRDNLLKNKKLSFTKNLGYLITRTKIRSINKLLSGFFTNINNDDLEISIRQFLISNLIGSRFYKSIYVSLTTKNSLYMALPLEWIQILNGKKVQVNKFLSFVILYFFMIKKLISAVIYFVKTCKKSFFQIFESEELFNSKSAYLMNLIADTVPKNNNNKYNIFNWYINHFNQDKSIKEIRHSLKNVNFEYNGFRCRYVDPIPPIQSFYKILIFIFYFLYALVFSLIIAFFLNPYYAIFLQEFLKEKHLKLVSKKNLPKEFLFNNENMIYRPFWTYYSEKKGIKIYLYNWSCGFPDLKTKDGYSCNEIGDEIQSWQYILQWSDLYLDYLKSVISSKRVIFKLCHPVFYMDSNNEFKIPKKKFIVLFDVIPLRKCFHDLLPIAIEYRTFSVSRKFFEDIYELSLKYNFNIIWKTKRKYAYSHSQSYIRYTKRFSKLPNVIKVEPETSAFKIIKNASGSISMPFTSTAQVAQINNINSIYYDPTRILFKDDRGRQNCELISGKNELDLWFKTL